VCCWFVVGLGVVCFKKVSCSQYPNMEQLSERILGAAVLEAAAALPKTRSRRKIMTSSRKEEEDEVVNEPLDFVCSAQL
jgi:3-phenylpropionate/cinnamic acid dioxygenase small subunit